MHGKWKMIFAQEMWLLFIEKSKLDSVLYKNEVKLGLVGQIPRSFRGMLVKDF